MKGIITTLILIFLLATSCGKDKKQDKTTNPSEKPTELVTTKPETLGIDTTLLNDLTQKIKDQYYENVHSVLIAKDGKLIYEEYFEGWDRVIGMGDAGVGVRQHSDSTLHDIRSVSKSFTSALVGIAHDKGFIKGVDQKVRDFFPEYDSLFIGEKANWTIKHMLTMTAGLAWREDVPLSHPDNSGMQQFLSKNPTEFYLSVPIDTIPGTRWNYNSGNTNLLGEIVARSSKKSLDEFAEEFLFKPLDINRFEWVRGPNSNSILADAGLRLTSRDLLKFGLLYRNKGSWNNKQIISEKWIDETFTRHVEFPCDPGYECSNYYGYQFWSWTEEILGREVDLWVATGNGNQKIIWDEKHDILIVMTAGHYSKTVKNGPGKMYRNHIYPAILNSKDD